MTRNQLMYWQNVETARSNLARETETNRSNLATEAETRRANIARETETRRANLAQEREINRANTARESEILRSNRANEILTSKRLYEDARQANQRDQLAQRQLEVDKQAKRISSQASITNASTSRLQHYETVRANQANERNRERDIILRNKQEQQRISETARANQARELETHRANVASETEQKRSNVARETETALANRNREFEQMRYNTIQADLRARELRNQQLYQTMTNQTARRGQNFNLVTSFASIMQKGVSDVISLLK